MAFSCRLHFTRSLYSRHYSRLSAPNKTIEKRIEELTKSLQSLYPVILTLGRTTRRHVERLKENTEVLEQEFKTTRTQLQEVTQTLDKTKTELQELYLRRELEYRKTRSDVSIIREINETENVLKEQEEKQQQIVDSHIKAEQQLFEKTRSSHQELYESTQNYAKRYIILGVVIGTVWTTWKSYQYFNSRTVTSQTELLSNSSLIIDTLSKTIEAQNESLVDKIVHEIKSLNLTSIETSNSNEEVKDDEEIVKQQDVTFITPTDKLNTAISMEQLYSCIQYSEVFVFSVIGGLVGSIIPLLLYTCFYR